METHYITHYSSVHSKSISDEFEEALRDSTLHYSMRHIILAGITSQENVAAAMERAMQVCSLAGVNIRYHFKQVYVSNENTGAVYTDWLMSRKGFNLMIMQSPELNEQIARWLWELAEE